MLLFPQEYPHLTTFFDGEIIGEKHPFLTRKWVRDNFCMSEELMTCVKFSYLSNRPHTLYGFTGVITHVGCWENTRKAYKSGVEDEWFISFSSVLSTSRMGYHACKPTESVVYCFYKITLSKSTVEFTGTINHRFLTNQNAHTILVIL